MGKIRSEEEKCNKQTTKRTEVSSVYRTAGQDMHHKLRHSVIVQEDKVCISSSSSTASTAPPPGSRGGGLCPMFASLRVASPSPSGRDASRARTSSLSSDPRRSPSPPSWSRPPPVSTRTKANEN